MVKIQKDRLYIQINYEDLLNMFWLITFFKKNYEIYISPRYIDAINKEKLSKIRLILDKRGIRTRFHVPVFDPYEDGYSIFKKAYERTVEFCKVLGADTMIMHAEYSAKKVPSVDEWIEKSKDVWRWIGKEAEKDNINVLIENHKEDRAEPILRAIAESGSKNMAACFDVGHFNAYGEKKVQEFLDDYPLGSIKEIHLSDNRGDHDTHMPLGSGHLNFIAFFEKLDEKEIGDVAYTLEAKDLIGVMRGLSFLKKLRRI